MWLNGSMSRQFPVWDVIHRFFFSKVLTTKLVVPAYLCYWSACLCFVELTETSQQLRESEVRSLSSKGCHWTPPTEFVNCTFDEPTITMLHCTRVRPLFRSHRFKYYQKETVTRPRHSIHGDYYQLTDIIEVFAISVSKSRGKCELIG